jgi:hypothetical protein
MFVGCTSSTSSFSNSLLFATASCECTLFVAGGAGGTATWRACTGTEQTQSLSANQTLIVCAQSGSAGLTGASSAISRGNEIASNPTCSGSVSSSCLPSASCINATFTQGNFDAGTYWYTDCTTGNVIASTLAKNATITVCLVSGSWSGIQGGGATISYGAACSSSATLYWSFSEVGGANGIYDLYINNVSVETRNNTANGTYTVNVGDVISVGCNADQCTGGGSTYTNIAVSGEITDAACQNNGSIPSYVSPGYTVVSGDVGTNLYMDLQVQCDGGCL